MSLFFIVVVVGGGAFVVFVTVAVIVDVVCCMLLSFCYSAVDIKTSHWIVASRSEKLIVAAVIKTSFNLLVNSG